MKSIIDEDLIAQEGLTGSTNVDKLLKVAEKSINSKCQTPEDCDIMIEKVQKESTTFNDGLGAMLQASRDLRGGNINQEEFANIIRASIASIQNEAVMLKISDLVKDTNDVHDEDIANVRAYIIGVSDLIRTRRAELTSSLNGSVNTASESFVDDEGYDLDDMEPGEEAVIDGTLYRMNDMYGLEVVEEGAFDRIYSAADISLESLTVDDCLPLYGAMLRENNENIITDPDFYVEQAEEATGWVPVYMGSQPALINEEGTVIKYAVAEENDTASFHTVTAGNALKCVRRALEKKEFAAQKTAEMYAATETFKEFLVASYQCENAEEAAQLITQTFGIDENSFDIGNEGVIAAAKAAKNSLIKKKEYEMKLRDIGKRAQQLMKDTKIRKHKQYGVEVCTLKIKNLKEAKSLWMKASSICNSVDNAIFGDSGKRSTYFSRKADYCEAMIEAWTDLLAAAKAAKKKGGGATESSSSLMGGIVDYIEDEDALSPAEESALDEEYGIDGFGPDDSMYVDDYIYSDAQESYADDDGEYYDDDDTDDDYYEE